MTAATDFLGRARVPDLSSDDPRDKTHLTQTGESNYRMVTDGAISLPPFVHKEHWTAEDAIRMRHLMVGFFRSPQGENLMGMFTERMWEISGREDGGRTNPYPGSILSTLCSRTWSHQDFSIIFAEDDFADMMHAAALSAPTEPLHKDEFFSDSGVVFFRTKIDLTDLYDFAEDAPNEPIRAISWLPIGGDTYMVKLWGDGRDAFVQDGNTVITDMIPYLQDEAFLFMVPGEDVPHRMRQIVALLRSMTAIARSSHARANDVKPRRPRKLRPEYRDVPIRRLSLVHAEYGSAELARARGKPHRLHWVRGHWRQQWYAKTEEHRTIWIEGHPRGNADLGKVGGEKVYVARAPHDDEEEEGHDD